MDTRKQLIAASVAILAMAATLAAEDATADAIATLKANLGNPAGLQVEEVRVTDVGVACIDYRVGQGSKNLGHAVVQDDKVLKSSAEYERFEKAWNEHCLGPRGGVTGDE